MKTINIRSTFSTDFNFTHVFRFHPLPRHEKVTEKTNVLIELGMHVPLTEFPLLITTDQ